MVEINKSYLNSLSSLSSSDEISKRALAQFKDQGIPNKKNEDYKYTNMQSFSPAELVLASASERNFKKQMDELGALPSTHRIVFGNGEFLEELSNLPDCISIETHTTPKVSDQFSMDSFSAINLIGLKKTISIRVEKAKQSPLVSLVHLHHLNEGETILSRVSVEAQELSQSTFLEIYHAPGEQSSFSNTLSSFTLEKGAHLTHIKAPLSGDNHSHVGKVTATLERDANFMDLTFSVTGRLNRNNIEVFCNGEGSHASVNGLYTGRSKQHHDSFCHVHHQAAHTTSTQLFKGILDDESRGVFTGKIVIHRDAQQVDSSQLNKNLLLSQKAHVDTRPQIEVYADDVKCGHGATVGQIDEEEVFYLESRGIPKEQAQKILCHAFTQEVIDTCLDKEAGSWLSKQLFDSFEKYALEKLANGSTK
jgi:Fe-S cluster assembly protein SufD